MSNFGAVFELETTRIAPFRDFYNTAEGRSTMGVFKKVQPGKIEKTESQDGNLRILIVGTHLGSVVVSQRLVNDNMVYEANFHLKIPQSLREGLGITSPLTDEKLKAAIGSADGKTPNIGVVIDDIVNADERHEALVEFFAENKDFPDPTIVK